MQWVEGLSPPPRRPVARSPADRRAAVGVGGELALPAISGLPAPAGSRSNGVCPSGVAGFQPHASGSRRRDRCSRSEPDGVGVGLAAWPAADGCDAHSDDAARQEEKHTACLPCGGHPAHGPKLPPFPPGTRHEIPGQRCSRRAQRARGIGPNHAGSGRPVAAVLASRWHAAPTSRHVAGPGATRSRAVIDPGRPGFSGA